MAGRRNSNRLGQGGVIIVALAVCTVVLFGAAALAIDAGRLFVNHNEAQTFVDAAALAAAHELDGTRRGILAAKSVVARSENRWDFESRTFDAPLVEFATAEKPYAWETEPADPRGFTRVRVTVSLQQRLLFAPLVAGPLRRTAGASAWAAAEQVPVSQFYEGLWPFAIPAEGLEPGQRRALTEWWGEGDPAVRILADKQLPEGRVAIGGELPKTAAAPDGVTALAAARILQDSDTESSNYATYLTTGTGNGRRVVVMPLVDAGQVRAFGMFFLLPEGGEVEYAGKAYLANSVHPGAGPPGAYHVRLVEGLP